MKLLLAIFCFTITGCAVDYTTKAGGRFRFELTGSPTEYLEAGRSYRK
jgi:hypothetical protein